MVFHITTINVSYMFYENIPPTIWHLPLSLNVKTIVEKNYLDWGPPSQPTLVAPESWNWLLERTEKAAWTLALGNTSEDLQPSSEIQCI